MKNIFILIAVTACFISACNNSDVKTASESTLTADTVAQYTSPSDLGAVAPVLNSDTAAMIPTPEISTTETKLPATSNATGNNPAHGQPGHRCDIAVGAPLNSAPIAAPAPAAGVSKQTPSQLPVQAPTSTTAPGMNPPHGQPGHDCAIAVGAPLKK